MSKVDLCADKIPIATPNWTRCDICAVFFGDDDTSTPDIDVGEVWQELRNERLAEADTPKRKAILGNLNALGWPYKADQAFDDVFCS